MLSELPAWRYDAPHPLTEWDRVRLLPDRVLGTWFTLERDTGKLCWRVTHEGPNLVVGIDRDVVIATQMNSGGPWSAASGTFAISLESGALLWSRAHDLPQGLAGLLLRPLGVVYDDPPRQVTEGEVLTSRGVVLETRTGKPLRRVAPPVATLTSSTDPAWVLYDDGKVPFEGGTLSRKWDRTRDELALERRDSRGAPLWKFSVREAGFHISGNWFSYRFVAPWLYLLVSDQPQSTARDPAKPEVLTPNAGRYSLLVLDARTGEIGRRIAIGDAPIALCRIEDHDDRSLLLSADGALLCHSRSA